MSHHAATEKDKHPAEELVEQVAQHPWMERVARFGYAAKGFVYMVIGATVMLSYLGLGLGRKTTDTRSALQTIEKQPFGKFALGTVAFGLLGYVVWRFIQAAADTDQKGSDLKGIAVRIGYTFSGLAYAGLALTAAKILIDVGEPDTDSEVKQGWAARAMSMPYGRWLVLLVGAGVVIFGLYQIYKGYKAKFLKRLKLDQMSRTRKVWASLSGRVGYAARGLVFCIVGIFLLQAGWQYDPGEVKGLDGVLLTLASQTFGPLMLGLVAAGLFAYGLYMMVEARYRLIAGS